MSDRPVIYCYDGSDAAKHALTAAPEALSGSPAIVITVWRSAWVATAGLTHAILPPENVDAVDQASAGAAAALAAEGAALVPDATSAAVKSNASVWQSILGFADAHDGSVIVVGARGRGDFKSTVLGSVSHGLVNHSHRPVLVVPPGD